jgi:hypothetical protein
MPDLPNPLPKPDALRRPEAPPIRPPVDPFNDPLNFPDHRLQAQQGKTGTPGEKSEKPASGLSSLDATHAFGSVMFSGVGRGIFVVLVCILAFGLTESCHRISLIDDGWRANGFRGAFNALLACPGALFGAPYSWMSSVGSGLTRPLTVPYFGTVLVGVILGLRSEIPFAKLALFYALLTAVYAATYFHMSNPLSLLLWFAILAGIVWLYRWYWRQQITLEDEPSGVDEENTDG